MEAFLAGGLAALLGAPRSLATAGALALAIESGAAARGLERQGMPAKLALAATLSGRAWALYHPARQLARYALLPATLLCLAAGRRRRGRLLIGLGAALTAPSLIDWYRLRPGLSPGQHVVAQLLDDVAYHLGILRGCVRERTLAPLAVEVRSARRRP
jgi:hypothetical protein